MSRAKAPLELVRNLIGRLGWSYGLHVVLTLALAALTLLPPQLFQYFATSLHGTAPANLALRLIGFGALLALALSVLGFINALSRERLQLKTESLLRLAATSQLMNRPLETFDGLPRGEFLTRLGSDLSKVETFVASSIPMHLRYAATLVIAGGLFFYQCGLLALVPLGVVVVAAALNFFGQRKLLPLLDELRTLHGGIFQDMLQSFETVRTIRSHGASRQHREHFAGRIQVMATKSLRAVGTAGFLDGANTFVYQVMIAACLAFAAWRVTSGKMDFQTALIFPFYLGFFYSSAESLVGAVGEWNRFFVESGRLAQFLRVADIGGEAPGTLPVPSRRLVARDLSIGYAGRPLAAPLQLDVEVGRTVVVVGPSGCGKSTLLDVFAGLRSPLAGSISDGAEQCAIVEQRACVWAGTVRSNLVIGTTESPAEEKLWEVLDSVGLRSLVQRNGGLDAKVDDRGMNFSEGQRYRLALARALLLPRPFLLLDEPFAALDKESITTVVRAINETKGKRGYLIVTHQIPAGLGVDEVMDFGGNAELGRAAYAGSVGL